MDEKKEGEKKLIFRELSDMCQMCQMCQSGYMPSQNFTLFLS